MKEANTLAAAGHAVTVLGVLSHRPSVVLDAEIVANANFQHITINTLQGTNAWKCRAHTRLTRELLRHVRLELPSSLGPATALLRAARRIPADLVIAHTEPALWVATRLLTESWKVAADFEDWHSEDLLPAERLHRPLNLLRKIERRLLHDAAYVTTTSAAMSRALHSRYGGTVPSVITNAFPLQPDPFALNPLHGVNSLPPRLCWFSQTIGPGRGLEEFLDVWSLTRTPSRLILLGESTAEYRAALLTRLPDSLVTAVEFNAPVAPDDLPGWIAQNHVGLALERTDITNRDLTITNKILQYLNAGLAVLATPTAGQREVLHSHPQAGLLIGLNSSPQHAANLIDQLLSKSGQLAIVRAAARQAAEAHYCWERESQRLLALVEKALR
ncbi:MAG: glycosyltransferase [Cephaloticoccus sp.]|nr:glycosyltransferase [Cephaloticoccus sp.]